MILTFFFFLIAHANAQAPELNAAPEVIPTATPAATEAAPAAKESSDYEVDYEEEPGADEAVEEPVVEKPLPVKDKKAKGKKSAKEPVLQGSRAEKRIKPLMKSETKSIYKKNGKSLDVDTD